MVWVAWVSGRSRRPEKASSGFVLGIKGGVAASNNSFQADAAFAFFPAHALRPFVLASIKLFWKYVTPVERSLSALLSTNAEPETRFPNSRWSLFVMINRSVAVQRHFQKLTISSNREHHVFRHHRLRIQIRLPVGAMKLHKSRMSFTSAP